MATIKDPSGVDILGADGLPIYFSLPDTLGSHGYITNVKRSLDKYLFDNIYTTNSIYVDYQGLSFSTFTVDEWIHPRIVDIKRTYLRQGSSTQYANKIDIFYGMFIYVKKGHQTTSDRHYKLKDIIQQYFIYNQKISLYNYVDNGAFVTYMKVREVDDNGPLQENNNLYSYLIQYRIDFTELILQA